MSAAEIIAQLPRLSPDELARVQARLKELVQAPSPDVQGNPITAHPALGIWKDRTDLPDDPALASKLLRERMMRTDHADS